MNLDFLETDNSEDDFDINPVFPHNNENKIKKEEILLFQSNTPKLSKIRENGLPQIVFCNDIQLHYKKALVCGKSSYRCHFRNQIQNCNGSFTFYNSDLLNVILSQKLNIRNVTITSKHSDTCLLLNTNLTLKDNSSLNSQTDTNNVRLHDICSPRHLLPPTFAPPDICSQCCGQSSKF